MTLHVGDTAPALSGSVNADLTGATAVAHIRKPDGTVLSKAATPGVVASGSTPWNAAAWAVGDLDQSGVHEVEVEVTYADTTVQTFGPQRFVVEPQIA